MNGRYIELSDGNMLCTKVTGGEVEKVARDGGGEPDLVLLVSTEAVDSDGDIVHQRRSKNGPGWTLDRFNNAPVITWQHDLNVPNLSGPGTRAKVRKHETKGQGLFLEPLRFDEGDMFALDLEGKVRRGVLKESSVGFIATHYTPREQKGDEEVRGYDIWGADLIEVAIVNRGANPDTEVLAKRLLGNPAHAGKVQDIGDAEAIELKQEIEHLHDVLKELQRGLDAVVREQQEKIKEAVEREANARAEAARSLYARLERLGLIRDGS